MNHANHDYPALARRWIDEIWNGRRDAMIAEMMHPDCLIEVEGLDGHVTPRQFLDYRKDFLSAIPDLRANVLFVSFDGDFGFLSWRMTGTHTGPGLGIAPSGRRVDISGVSFLQFHDGLIVRKVDRWNRGEMIASLLRVRMEELREAVGLTSREAQVALMMSERMTHAEISEVLGISPNTARRHCERVLQKLGVNRRQDVATALRKMTGSVLARRGGDQKAS